MQLTPKELNALKARLGVPYPERHEFLRELTSDMQEHYQRLIDDGMTEEQASKQVRAAFSLTAEDLSRLEEVHLNFAGRMLHIIPEKFRDVFVLCIKWCISSLFVFQLTTEAPMVQFLRDGGVIIYVILGLGGFVLLSQLYRCFRWFVRRDHSDASLASHTSSPITAAVLITMVGFFGTATGYYVVFHKWANNLITLDDLKYGLYEPLPCLIVATLLGSTIVVIHWASNSRLRSIGALAS